MALLTELTHRAPKLSGRRVEDLYTLLEQYGDDVLRAAISRAVAAGRLRVPAQPDHRFRRKLITDSGPS
jgi:hypothetical protein